MSFTLKKWLADLFKVNALVMVFMFGAASVTYAQPISPFASELTTNSFKVEWAAGSGYLSFEFQVAVNSSFNTGSLIVSKTVTGTFVNVTGLTSSTQYWFRVRGLVAGGQPSAWGSASCNTISNSSNIYPVFISNTMIRVNWVTVPNSQYYSVQLSTDSNFINDLFSGTIAGTTYLFSGLSPGTTYYIRVSGMPSFPDPAWMTTQATTNTTCLAGTISPSLYGNLPVWPLVTGSSLRVVDWINAGQAATNVSSNASTGPTGVGVSPCGRKLFYVIHSGAEADNQLHIYTLKGVPLTNNNNTAPDPNYHLGLNAVGGNSEIQVVPVPKSDDLFYIIYSLRYSDGCSLTPKEACPAIIAYSKVRYDPYRERLTILERDQRLLSSNTYAHGKAVSRPITSHPLSFEGYFHFLYLAKRSVGNNTVNFERWRITANGIECWEAPNSASVAANYWSMDGQVEISQDGSRIAFLNKHEDTGTTGQDIVIYDETQFYNSAYVPLTLKIPDLKVQYKVTPGGPIVEKTIAELATTAPYNFTDLQKRMNAIEFSPNGRYLYVAGGGYQTLKSYLLQIDLQSNGTSAAKNVRVLVQNLTQAGSRDLIGLQSADDANFYFTKRGVQKLFVLPDPDEQMPQNLDGTSDLDMGVSSIPNIDVSPNTSSLILPDGIDGFNYITTTLIPSGSFDSGSAGIIYVGRYITYNFDDYSFWQPFVDTYISWGDGVTQKFTYRTQGHRYKTPGDKIITISQYDKVTGCRRVLVYPITVEVCPSVGNPVINYENFICAAKFSVDQHPDYKMSFVWNFGDGTATSTERAPVHVYSAQGPYTVSVTINYYNYFCVDTRTITLPINWTVPSNPINLQTITVPTDTRPNIISSNASTFDDTSPLSYSNDAVDNMNPFENGSRGVWRNNATYAYRADRSQNAGIRLDTDGTYSMDQFNWKFAELDAIPTWIKATQITGYSPYGFELENKDALGNYSAAIYDYGGQLPVANGVNMKQDEIAFTSFEYLNDGTAYGYSSDLTSGNWMFSGTNTLPAYMVYNVPSANKNMTVVETPLSEIQSAAFVDVVVRNGQGALNPAALIRNTIVCSLVHPQNANWSIVVLKTAPYEGVWSGQLKVKNVTNAGSIAVLDTQFKHSGKSSMKVVADKTFKQDLVNLIPGKTYWVNAWVFANNVSSSTPSAGSGLGIDIVTRAKNGVLTGTTNLTLAGPLIEGWQQIRGSFICPANTSFFDIIFKKGTGTAAWYDDLRIQPESGNMKCYVYSIQDFRLNAILDEENFATYFFYDKEGNLYLTKKETKDGIKTLSENISHMTH
jgi:PKD repeat protein